MQKTTNLLNSFDPSLDFWFENPQLKILFSKENKDNVPSHIMWALFLYCHPDSKFIDEDEKNRSKLIREDYLQDPTFNFKDYSSTINKILDSLPSKAARMLVSWKKKLEEREDLISNIEYTLDTFEMVDKLLANSSKLWDQYEAVEKKYLSEKEHRVQGEIEESLLEQRKF